MVYEQDGRRWIFFHDLFGRWQWALVDPTGITLQQAKVSFVSYCSCMKDARKQGFRMRSARSTRSRDQAPCIALAGGENEA